MPPSGTPSNPGRQGERSDQGETSSRHYYRDCESSSSSSSGCTCPLDHSSDDDGAGICSLSVHVSGSVVDDDVDDNDRHGEEVPIFFTPSAGDSAAPNRPGSEGSNGSVTMDALGRPEGQVLTSRFSYKTEIVEKEWKEAVSAGKELDASKFKDSDFTVKRQLTQSGWEYEPALRIMHDVTASFQGIDGVYKKLGISQENRVRKLWAHRMRFYNCQMVEIYVNQQKRTGSVSLTRLHQQFGEKEEREKTLVPFLKPTDAFFLNDYNVEGKAIIMIHGISPLVKISKATEYWDATASSKGKELPFFRVMLPWQHRMPNLRHWSDVTWLAWMDTAKESRAGDLVYILHAHVTSESTQAVMRVAVERYDPSLEGGKIRKWPGTGLNAAHEEFFPLLQTPHGRAVVYLVRQHQKVLRGKHINAIRIFQSEDERGIQMPSMLFILSEKDPDYVHPDEKPETSAPVLKAAEKPGFPGKKAKPGDNPERSVKESSANKKRSSVHRSRYQNIAGY